MLLFGRQLTLNGNPRATMPWATEITSYVNAHSALDVSLWASNFGFPIGTVTWTTMVESMSQLADATASLIVDPGYLDLVEAATNMVTVPGQDQLGEIIYGTPDAPAAVGAVAQVTTATAIVDQMGAALTFAVEVAQHIEKIIATPIFVLTSLYGAMGGITWIGVQPDMAAVDAARAKAATDSTYLDQLAKTKGLFIPGSGHVSQAVRIA